MKKTLAVLAVMVVAVAIAPRLSAQSGIVYTNQACYCSAAHIVAYNEFTGAVVQTYSGVTGNGRGVVVVGNTIYYTMEGQPDIFMLDKTTGGSLGAIPMSVASGSTIAWDGSQFWISDYTGNSNAYRVNLSGVTTNTISLPGSGNYFDGMEYFNGKLIANRQDGYNQATSHYDIYDLTGTLITADFIQAPYGTGIAYDGTNFLVSDVNSSVFGVYDGVSGAFIKNVTYADGNYNIEDLSVDYAARQDTGNVTPEPSTIIMMLTGLFGVAGAGLLRRQVA